jgi:hypothetical protein
MINPFCEVNWNPGLAGRRAFAKSIAIGFPLIALVLGALGLLRAHAWPVWTLWLGNIGAASGIALWLVPQIAGPFYVVWNALGCCIGFVVSNVAVTAVYLLVVTPIGLALRMLGRDPLRRRFERERASYWEDAEKTGDAERYFRQH